MSAPTRWCSHLPMLSGDGGEARVTSQRLLGYRPSSELRSCALRSPVVPQWDGGRRELRWPVQNFVGAGAWDDEAIMSELRQHVREELADADAVLVLDPSAFAKKGTESCGVDRQWCGRLGKLDNCQVGVFWGYASVHGRALVDRRLYLTKDWAKNRARRKKCHVPKEVVFQEKWRIGLERLALIGSDLPHGWIAADDEFGRVTEFRAVLRQRRERYVVDIPSNTLMRVVGERTAEGRKAPFVRVDTWAAQQPSSRWQKLRERLGIGTVGSPLQQATPASGIFSGLSFLAKSFS